MDYVIILSKLVLGFIGLLIVMRLLGKKELADITPFDVIYSVVFGGILEESLYDKRITLGHLLFGIFSWGLIIYLVELLSLKFEFARGMLKGSPSYLIEDGKINMKNMRKNKLEMEQLRSLMRTQGVFSLKEIKYLILEPGGQLSILKYDKYETPTKEDWEMKTNEVTTNYLLINNGKVSKKEMQLIHKDEAWLEEEVKKQRYPSIKSVSYAEWSENDGLYIKQAK